MGDADVDIILKTIKDPHCSVFAAASDRWRSRGGGPPQRIANRTGVYATVARNRRGQAEENSVHHGYLQPRGTGPMSICQRFCANVSALVKVTDKATLLSMINGAVCPLVQLKHLGGVF